MSTAQARGFLIEILTIAIPALNAQDATLEQQRRFADSLVRALDQYLDERAAPKPPGEL